MHEPQPTFDLQFSAYAQSGQHFLEIERYDLAERDLRQALLYAPEDPYLHFLLGRALDGLGRTLEAEEEAQTAMRLDPESVLGVLLLGKLRMDQGRHQEAEQLWLDALRLDPTEPILYLNYALLMRKTGHLDKAERLLQRCLVLDPENAHAHGTLALILAEKNQKAGATRHGERGLSLDPDRDVSHVQLGITYLQTGHPFKARYHLREALRLDPRDRAIEETYLLADRATRAVYLPFYFWSLWVDRIPGKQFAVWGAYVVLISVLRSSPVPKDVVSVLSVTYLAFMIYTWVATPLVKLWVRIRPPQ
jgi:tetratricopeptide (TPR) repeat protein